MNKDTRLSDVLHVLLHLGQMTQPVTSEVLAKSLGTNPAVFRRTMAGLREVGYVSSEKGHGGGWTLSRPLSEITLQDVYFALGSPALFAIGSRDSDPACLVQRRVDEALADTMAQAEALLLRRFKAITLDDLAPKLRTQFAEPCDNTV